MKVVLHIPTEQFGFCQVEPDSVSPEAVAEVYGLYAKAFEAKPVNSLPDKEWNAALDEFLLTDTLKDGVEIYGKMSPTQQAVFQEIKKSLKRIKSKETKPVIN